MDIRITQIGIDECVTANCTHSTGCVSRYNYSHVPTIITAGSVSLASVMVLNSAQCTCAARESQHLFCSSYRTNPCLNGGTCIDTDLGYRLVKLFMLLRTSSNSKWVRKGLREANQHSSLLKRQIWLDILDFVLANRFLILLMAT